MTYEDDARAQFMAELIHDRGRVSRAELIATMSGRFGPIDRLNARLLKHFRSISAGEIRYEAAGQYWESLRRRSYSG